MTRKGLRRVGRCLGWYSVNDVRVWHEAPGSSTSDASEERAWRLISDLEAEVERLRAAVDGLDAAHAIRKSEWKGQPS